jgi:ABC-type sugar transport system permease subunit
VKRNNLVRFALLTQAVGAIFFAIFLTSYALALPSNKVLHGEQIFRTSLSIFGGLFLALVVIAVVLSIIVKPED